jgi:small-conductance mechanosensitive channel
MSGWSVVWQTTFLGNPLDAWVVSGAVFLVTFTLLPLAKRFISAQRHRRLAKHGPVQTHYAADLALLLVARTKPLFLFGAAIWLASRDLSFPPRLERWFIVSVVLLFWMQVALWAMVAVRFAIDARRLRSTGPDTLLKSSMEVILFAAGLVIWGVAMLLALDNLGVEIRPLLAGLGIGGIALALSVQTVLADLLASLAIALDRPFGIGDALTIDDCTGTVEHIGVKSTRLRSLGGEQIILSNSDLLKARVRNFGRLQERRALFVLDVHYETPVATLAAVPRVVREIIGVHSRYPLRPLPHAALYERGAAVRDRLFRHPRRLQKLRGCTAEHQSAHPRALPRDGRAVLRARAAPGAPAPGTAGAAGGRRRSAAAALGGGSRQPAAWRRAPAGSPPRSPRTAVRPISACPRSSPSLTVPSTNAGVPSSPRACAWAALRKMVLR